MYLVKTRLLTTTDDFDSANLDGYVSEGQNYEGAGQVHTRAISCRVTNKQSPQLRAFFKQKPLTLTLDTGADTCMIKASVVRSLGLTIEKFFQKALPADGTTPLIGLGETHVLLSRSNKHSILDALLVEDLDVDVLAGVPFLIANDISVRPTMQQITIHGFEILYYLSKDKHNIDTHTFRAGTSYVYAHHPLLLSFGLANIFKSMFHLSLELIPPLQLNQDMHMLSL